MGEMLTLWWLIVGHAAGDFWLQSDALAKMKNRHREGKAPPGADLQIIWPYALTAHALMHGGIVAMATGSVVLGCIEAVAHWLIDFGKCENWYGIHTDQALHVVCKILYVCSMLIWA